jgi:hypothetical protein
MMRGPRLGVCLATSSTICITELKAHEKQDYDKLTRPKTTESLRMRAYVLMYNQQLCAHGQAGYMQLLLLCESLWLATSAKWRTDLKVHMKSKEDRKIKIKLSGKKTSLR